MTKFKRLKEAYVGANEFLKAVSKMPDTEVRDPKNLKIIFDDLIDCDTIFLFSSIEDLCRELRPSAEHLAWSCLNSKMPPEPYSYEEPVIYDVYNDEVIGLKNKNFNSRKFSTMLKKADFSLRRNSENALVAFVDKFK